MRENTKTESGWAAGLYFTDHLLWLRKIVFLIYSQEQEDRANRAKSKKGNRGDDTMGEKQSMIPNLHSLNQNTSLTDEKNQ